MLKQFFISLLILFPPLLNAQKSYSVNGKKDYSFSETKTSENVKDLLSADDINGFSFNPVRNKAVVELIFKVPNISKYEVIIVEHGDSAHGFTPCLTINLKEEKNLSESFTKIDKYPLPYTVRTFYRVKSLTADGIIRYFPYIMELHNGDKESLEKLKLEQEKQAREMKEKDDALLKTLENSKNGPSDDSWRNAKPVVVSGGKTVDTPTTTTDEEPKEETDQEKIDRKLARIKAIEEEMKEKLEELKKLMEEK
jgi:hypothetical protein